jgi:hypothetical protein
MRIRMMRLKRMEEKRKMKRKMTKRRRRIDVEATCLSTRTANGPFKIFSLALSCGDFYKTFVYNWNLLAYWNDTESDVQFKTSLIIIYISSGSSGFPTGLDVIDQ